LVLVDTLRNQPLLALRLTTALVAGKFLAAWCTGKLFGYSRAETWLR
jgi:Kef-type K+ transport system membrane component KefB